MEEGRRRYFRKWGRLPRGREGWAMMGSCRSWVQEAQVQRAGEWEDRKGQGTTGGWLGAPTGARG